MGGIGAETILPKEPQYQATHAHPTESLDKLLVFRACHPIYGAFLVDWLGIANEDERIQLLESVLEIPRPLLKFVRVPGDVSQGAMTLEKLDPELIAKGLIIAKPAKVEGEEENEEEEFEERPPTLAETVRMLFDAIHPDITDVNTQSVWSVGELLRYGGNFNQYVTSNDLTKQEGIIFRHALRFILLLEEFIQLTPPGIEKEQWERELRELGDKLTEACRKVDPTSTEETIKKAHAADIVEGEEHAKAVSAAEVATEPEFGAGILE